MQKMVQAPFPDANNRWYVRSVLESNDACVNYLCSFGLLTTDSICKGLQNQIFVRQLCEIYDGNELWWSFNTAPLLLEMTFL